ncbi:MAG: NusG domain II-containing protein [Clostridia bacterium]|nr:NusG domain II-containing protein [Clostridia bacterium]MBQ4574544.1 NusG domain II-containing protein [Clostridia bacterium]
MRTRFTVWDGAVYLAVLLLAILLLVLLTVSKTEGETLSVTCGGEITHYPLSQDRELTLENNGYTLTVVIRGGKASVDAADCPDRLCRRMGEISRSGESVACLPAGIYIRIEGGEANEADFIAG